MLKDHELVFESTGYETHWSIAKSLLSSKVRDLRVICSRVSDMIDTFSEIAMEVFAVSEEPNESQRISPELIKNYPTSLKNLVANFDKSWSPNLPLQPEAVWPYCHVY